VEGLVLGLRGANARRVVAGVEARLRGLEQGFPEGVHARIFYNRGHLVERAVGTVSRALVEAIVLVLVLLALFLGNLRAALTVALVLPLAALVTFILMYRFGMSANLMSLGGLAIAIGMLVDAAVVVVENIVTHLAHADERTRLPRLHLIYRASREVAIPVASGILIIVIVFLPLLTLQGLEGKLFIPVALTIVFALVGSLLLSLTVIPVLSSFILGRVGHDEPLLVRLLGRIYHPSLTWALRHERLIIAVAALLLAVASWVYLQVGKTFMPVMDEGDLIVQLEKLPTITLAQSLAIDSRFQRDLMERVPEVVGVVSRTGSDELGLDPMGLNQTDSFLQLKPRQQWTVPDKETLMDRIREVLADYPGVSYAFTQPIEMRVSEMLTGVRGDLAVKIFGDDQDELNRLAEELVALLRALPGAEDVYTPRNEGVRYLSLRVDRLAAGRLGLAVDDLEQDLRALVEGVRLGTVYEGGRRIPLQLRGPETLRASPSDFAELQLVVEDTGRVPLQRVADLRQETGPVAINREQGKRMAVVIANVSGRDLVGFVEEAREAVSSRLQLPAGYYLAWGGQFENQQRASRRLAIVVPVALGLIFLVLFATFRSIGQAVLVLSNVPFALVGGIIALWLTGEYLSVPAAVGFIALLGISVLNGVVMVSHFNQQRALGRSGEAVVVAGAMRRLRPVMMTASIAALGLVPLLLATGPGSEIQRPLAVVVIGGLVSATFLTLILLPLLYLRFFLQSSEG
ncbi:MAG: efflux RND transporter permease subunit, partial [Gammaproteobacteria bacterium]